MRYLLLFCTIITSKYVLSYHHKMRRSFLLMRTFISENKIDAYNEAKKSLIKMPCIILVNPFLDANVGSVSRAMLNFGIHDLRIVNPECDILSETAKTLAVGSVEVLKNAKIFKTLEECIADLDIVVATTARIKRHNLNQILYNPEEAVKEIIPIDHICNAGIMFGRERSGLSNEEIALANIRVAIPTFEHYEVLNLAQAVNIIAYECSIRKLDLLNKLNSANESDNTIVDSNEEGSSSIDSDSHTIDDINKFANNKELNYFFDRLLTLSTKSNTNNDENMQNISSKLRCETSIKTIFKRAMLRKGEVAFLHGLLTKIVNNKDSNI